MTSGLDHNGNHNLNDTFFPLSEHSQSTVFSILIEDYLYLGIYCCKSLMMILLLSNIFQVRIMRKRLVRKTFDMIQDISESENKEVCSYKAKCYLYFIFSTV